jgi:hypothetical protein
MRREKTVTVGRVDGLIATALGVSYIVDAIDLGGARAPPVAQEGVMGSTVEKIKGMANKAAEKVKQGVGEAIGSKKMQDKGKAQEIK